MLVLGVEQEDAKIPQLVFNNDMEIRIPSILNVLFVMIFCVCSLALAAFLLLTAVQKAATVYVQNKKRTRAPHPYYYSIISG